MVFHYRKSCFYETTWKNTVVSNSTHENIILRTRFSSWMIKTKETPHNMQSLHAFCGNNGNANAPQCYVTPTLPVLVNIQTFSGLSYESWRYYLTFQSGGLQRTGNIIFEINWFSMPLEFMNPPWQHIYSKYCAGVTRIGFHLKIFPSELLSSLKT
jgi:hypothetical protein